MVVSCAPFPSLLKGHKGPASPWHLPPLPSLTPTSLQGPTLLDNEHAIPICPGARRIFEP